MSFEDIFENEVYILSKDEKEKILTQRLLELTELHAKKCPEYKRILDSISYNKKKVSSYTDLPFLPVRLFKELELKSVQPDEVVKTMTSSGTSGQNVSKIFLDRNTAAYQQKALVKIVSEFTGATRMPMIIIDCPSVIKDRNMFSARGAGILGFSILGAKKVYALDDDMQLNVNELREFLCKYSGQRIFLFGFTYMLWQHFYKELVRIKEETGEIFDLSNAVLIHGGGWKKLEAEAVSNEEFHDRLNEVCGLNDIHDYYGMVEQTGCIYMQCECGHLHASIFSDIIIRNPKNFSECDVGEKGIIQVVSTLPESYPGHSLLTEDEGMIIGVDDCPCGRKGKYFKILGRIKNAEIRGCSDTYASDYTKNNKCTDKIEYLIGEDNNIIENYKDILPRKPFDDEICQFLERFSRELLTDKNAKAYADIVTLGFWLRKASILQLRKRFDNTEQKMIRVGRGVVFHIAPSNVAVNYMYSLVSSLLMGNANVVRVPTKDFPQIKIINDCIKRVLKQHKNIRQYITLVRYNRSKEINDVFSDMCDVRIVWGGNQTIDNLRKSKIKPRTTDINFADRYSFAIIDSDVYCGLEDKEKVAKDFYNDTYLSDQNACTSPKFIAWVGTKKNEAREIFWNILHELVENKYYLQTISVVDKLTKQYLIATEVEGIKNIVDKDNYIVRVEVDNVDSKLSRYFGNCGLFYEYECDDIFMLRGLCNDIHCQTISYIGNDEMLIPLISSGIRGVDRVVNIGDTMSFDLIWDGYNLAERLTRTISLG